VSTHSTPVRVALVGCGAVAQLYYQPALRALEREGLLRLVAAHDPNPAALTAFSAAFPAVRRLGSFEDVLEQRPKLVIIASPPRHHRDQTVAALEAGADVHCEKPLAPDLAAGEQMVAAAAATGRRLTVGMLRRHFPATQVIGRLLAAGAIGPLESVDCFEGGPFAWPVRSLDYFRPASGGVLQDIGTHCLDLLTWWLGVPTSVAYADDAMGGVEANCSVALTLGGVPATVRLSRDWPRPNRYVLTGRDGWLSWTVNETNRFDHGIRGTRFAGAVTLHEVLVDRPQPALGAVASEFDQAFAQQLRVLVDPRTDPSSCIGGAEALPTLALIDRCYASATRLPMPWLQPAAEPVS